MDGTNTTITPFRFWCQKVLPAVYNDELDYYTLMCKMTSKLNETITAVNEIPDEIMQYITEEGILANLQSNMLLDIINIKYPYDSLDACVGDGVTDDTVNFQNFINYASSHNKRLYIPNGHYKLTKQGQISGGSSPRNYCIMLPSNTIILGESMEGVIFVAGDTNDDADVFTTVRTEHTTNIHLRNFTINGNYNASNNDGFNIWLYDNDWSSIDYLKSINSASWGVRVEKTSNSQYTNIWSIQGAETNADGMHLVDCHDVICDNINCYSEGDDGFVVEAFNQNCYNLTLTNIHSETPNLLNLPARAIVFFGNNTTSRDFYNIRLDGKTKNSNGYGFLITRGNYYNCTFNVLDDGSNTAFYMGVGINDNFQQISDCTFNLSGINTVKDGMLHVPITDDDLIKDCVFNVNLTGSMSGNPLQFIADSCICNFKIRKTSNTGYYSQFSGNNNIVKWIVDTNVSGIYLTNTAYQNTFDIQEINAETSITIQPHATKNVFTGHINHPIVSTARGNDYSHLEGCFFNINHEFTIPSNGINQIYHGCQMEPTCVTINAFAANPSISCQIQNVRDGAIYFRFEQGGNVITSGTMRASIQACYTEPLLI